jgi:hypothetical protein
MEHMIQRTDEIGGGIDEGAVEVENDDGSRGSICHARIATGHRPIPQGA